MAARNSGTVLSWVFHAHCSSLSSKYIVENLFSFGNRLQASILRGVVTDLLLERFRNTEISGGK